MFKKLLIETHSACNRACPTCMRQNDPRARARREYIELPAEIVHSVIDQATQLRFKGPVGLVWFNEPLMDPRIPVFARYVKQRGLYVYVTTNGDLLTPELAMEFDGVLNHIGVSVYGPDPEGKRHAYFRSLFQKTPVWFYGEHVVTHFSPHSLLHSCIKKRIERRCWNPQNRLIITYTGEMAFCCEDLACNFNLGNIRDHSLEELWFNKRHQRMLFVLNQQGGRHNFPYCEICPRTGGI